MSFGIVHGYAGPHLYINRHMLLYAEVKLSGLSTPSTDAGPPVNFNERLTEVLEGMFS